jgi:DNA polymerase elongation subunit (family B)
MVYICKRIKEVIYTANSSKGAALRNYGKSIMKTTVKFNKGNQSLEVSNFEIYGLTTFPYLFIFDNYKGDIDYDPTLVKLGTIDIECAADEGFPDIQKANKEITAITVRYRGKSFVFGCGEFRTNDPAIHYFKCKDEHQLILQFLNCWEALDLDIITGWNIEFFDICIYY